jgi:hypothetical protein
MVTRLPPSSLPDVLEIFFVSTTGFVAFGAVGIVVALEANAAEIPANAARNFFICRIL